MNDLYRQYPRLLQFDMSRNDGMVQDMLGPQPAHITAFQQQAYRLIEQHGEGTPAQKEAAMICAALVIEPQLLYMDMPNLIMNYGVEVENAIEPLMGARPNEALPPVIAYARAASGIVLIENMLVSVAKGEPLGGKTADVLAHVKASFGQDEISFANIDGSPLVTRFLTAKDELFSKLEAKLASEAPAPRKNRGKSFDL
ncbi:MAG: hypothetical protein PSY14_09810 [bacterium]|nr:hypothetical protein [bacterium]